MNEMGLIHIGDNTVELFTQGDGDAPLILLNTFEGEGEGVWRAARALTDAPFSLAAIGGLDWNGDLSPWPAPPVFRGDGGFSGGADAYLARLTGELLPVILDALASKPSALGLAGYSMAGLFALYAAARSSRFDRFASASGSMWFPGFADFAQAHLPQPLPRRVYLSVGDREARTRNPVMRTVEDNTRRLRDIYAAAGVDVRFELNPGNHFQQPDARMARGVAWLAEDQSSSAPSAC